MKIVLLLSAWLALELLLCRAIQQAVRAGRGTADPRWIRLFGRMGGSFAGDMLLSTMVPVTAVNAVGIVCVALRMAAIWLPEIGSGFSSQAPFRLAEAAAATLGLAFIVSIWTIRIFGRPRFLIPRYLRDEMGVLRSRNDVAKSDGH